MLGGSMLGDCNARTQIAVKDLATAKHFYQDVLGLKLLSENAEALTFQSGNGMFNTYRSQYAGTNQATYLSWDCANVEEMVNNLKTKGVEFEHYDGMPGMTRQGDVHIMGQFQSAWFKDPDGNILNIANVGMM